MRWTSITLVSGTFHFMEWSTHRNQGNYELFSILRTATKVFSHLVAPVRSQSTTKHQRAHSSISASRYSSFSRHRKNVSSGESSREGPTSLAVSLAKPQKQRSTSNLPYDSSHLWGYLISIRLLQCFKTHCRLLRRILSVSGVQSQVVLSGQLFGLFRHRRRNHFLLLSSHRDVA